MQKSRLYKNTISSLLLQIVNIISGFILPRLILSAFGSDVNGLVNSITQFLQLIAFLDLGVGAVVQSSLYKPLADNDEKKISEIYTSGQRFFSRIAQILLGYVLIIICIYPLITRQSFSFFDTALLIAIMSLSSFAQYYFGVMNGLLLVADQKGYIQYSIQIVTVILNTFLCYLLIQFNASIHIVKFVSSTVFLLKPLFLYFVVKRCYNINSKSHYEVEPIKQKWNGLSQHIASVVLESTDTIVLTVFSTLKNVSIYSVYYLVISGIKQLFTSTTLGIQSLLGELYAKNNKKRVEEVFQKTEWIVHTMTVFIFGCANALLIPFVKVYTLGIMDANYEQPFFAALIVIAYAFYCLRIPYHIMIKAAVKYKETQNCYLISAIANLIISIVSVARFGLVGVAVGTLVAMIYQTLWMAWYNYKHIVGVSISLFIKQLLVDIVCFAIGTKITGLLQLNDVSYLGWLMMAIKSALIWSVIVIVANLLVYKNEIRSIFKLAK